MDTGRRKSLSPRSSTIGKISSVIATKGKRFDIYAINKIIADQEETICYALDKQHVLGTGAFGKVHKAYLIPHSTTSQWILATENNIIEETNAAPVAVKLLVNELIADDEAVKNEVSLFDKYYEVYDHFTHEHHYLIFMKLLPSHNLFITKPDNSIVPNEIIKSLSLKERLHILMQLTAQLNLFHHYTPSTGAAIIHRDLKGENIQITYDPKHKTISVYILDFGVAITTEDSCKEITANIDGSKSYTPYEALSGSVGYWTDIYALVPIFLVVLGVSDPFKDKNQIAKEKFMRTSLGDDFYKKKYSCKGLLDDCQRDDQEKLIIKAMFSLLIEHMQNDNYMKRPTSDKVLRAVTDLYQYIANLDELNQQTDNKDELQIIKNKMEIQLARKFIGLVNTKQEEKLGDIPVAKDSLKKSSHLFYHSTPKNMLAGKADMGNREGGKFKV